MQINTTLKWLPIDRPVFEPDQWIACEMADELTIGDSPFRGKIYNDFDVNMVFTTINWRQGPVLYWAANARRNPAAYNTRICRDESHIYGVVEVR